jgi:hypothetical protein
MIEGLFPYHEVGGSLKFLYFPFEAGDGTAGPEGYHWDHALPYSVLRRSMLICITHLMRHELCRICAVSMLSLRFHIEFPCSEAEYTDTPGRFKAQS